MKAIGFKNFRKFEDFPSISLSPISIFVGGNNSGKSTTVKAIISVLTFLRNARFETRGSKGENSILTNNFYFNQNPYVHIGTFQRAKCNKVEHNNMFFEAQIEELHFSIWLNGDGGDKNTTYARLDRIVMEDIRLRSTFDLDFANNKITCSFKRNIDLFESDTDYINMQKKAVSLLERKNNGEANIDRLYERHMRQFHDRFPIVEDDFEVPVKITDIAGRRMIGGPLLSGMIYNMSYFYMDIEDSESRLVPSHIAEKLKALQNYMFTLSHRIDSLMYMTPLMEYIYAHAASQIVLYNSADNNYLSRTVHEFAELRKESDIDAYEFVDKWMDFFEIGKTFDLQSIGGEAHTLDIVGYDGKTTPLADKGMGTIQLLILLLRISLIVNSKNKYARLSSVPTIVIVEEPEQNLHPKKQSLLIDFFHAIYEQYHIRFIIETHSEYMIRRSQVMVAESKFKSDEELNEKCPFKVYYFPQDGTPYDMKYQTNGRFERQFGNGFFDEASTSALILSKIERGRI